MSNIERYHEIIKLVKAIEDFNDNATTTLKCNLIYNLCNRGTANERLGEDTADNKHMPDRVVADNAYSTDTDKNTVA